VVRGDVGVDQRGDRRGDMLLDPADGVGELGVAAGTTAEEELVGAPVLGHEPEVRGEAVLDLLVRTAGVRGRLGDEVAEAGADILEELEVEVPLGREVLVEHRLGHTRGIGHVVHRCCVESLAREDLERGVQELTAAFGGWQTDAHGVPTVFLRRGR
jgi:hypothetical protein